MHRNPTRTTWIATAALVVMTLTLLVACGANDDKATATPSRGVTLQLVTFKPDVLTVKAGTTVTWTQKDPGFHTVTSGNVEQGAAGVSTAPDGRFDSGELATEKTFRFTFDDPGTYPYFCQIHPATMRGQVRVT